ncbi:unnamed protein product [Ceratitis capitata]|uniref:(Mediterranean fruit fly) hypothetical protein n=1 Tax=Ceratitis capitata TaxID=7213 RepID=A0A811UHL5_CERCA|nr:unnamed protein product [Ceratitis capitata]
MRRTVHNTAAVRIDCMHNLEAPFASLLLQHSMHQLQTARWGSGRRTNGCGQLPIGRKRLPASGGCYLKKA